MINFYNISRRLGKGWKAIIVATLVVFVLILAIVIKFADYGYLGTIDPWINLFGIITLAGEFVAVFIILMLAKKMRTSQFEPGIGLLAIGLFYWMLSDLFWFANSNYLSLYLIPKYGIDEWNVSDSAIYWMLSVGQKVSAVLQGIFIALATIAMKEIFEATQKLEVKIDQERAKKEVAKIVESDYFEKIKKDAIDLRRKRDTIR